MPDGLSLLELIPAHAKASVSKSKLAQHFDSVRTASSCSEVIESFIQLASQEWQDKWLLLWSVPARKIKLNTLQVWLHQLEQAPSGLLVSYPCVELIEQSQYQHWITPRPYPALPWLYQQNPLGGIIAIRPGLLRRLDFDALKQETSIEGLIHALWLNLTSLEPLKPHQVLRSNEVVCQLPLKEEQRFYYPNQGLAKRIDHFGHTFSPSLKAQLPQQANSPASVSPSLMEHPLVSILIPFKNQPQLLRQCLDSILRYSKQYPHFEVIGINNQSTCPETLDLMRRYSQQERRVQFIDYDKPFNFSAINNLGAQAAKGEHLVLMNNDIQLLTPDWLPQLLAWSSLPGTGFVGAKLYYPNDTTQHTGCTLGLFGHVDHCFKHRPRHEPDPWHWTCVTRNVTCVTAALAMIKKSVYEEVGGFDETNFVVLHNDMDLSLKVHEAGYNNLVVGSCEAYHHESVSLSSNKLITIEQNTARREELERFLSKYKGLIEQGDPYFSPYLNHYDLANHPTDLILGNYHQDAGSYKRLVRTRLPLCGKTASLVRFDTANKGRQYRLLMH
jgi:GT2 family glycosyltransferase